MLIDIIVIGLIIYFIVRHKKNKAAEAAAAAGATTKVEPEGLNIDNDYFLIRNGHLLEYRGQSDTIMVPRGVTRIGLTDTPIWNRTIDSIFIPNTVHFIYGGALPYVESVVYEGSPEELSYDKDENFFANGWIPDWTKTEGHLPSHVWEVRFHFNQSNYAAIEKAHFEQNPHELLPRAAKEE